MPELAPLMRDQRKVDADHLRLLAIFHFIAAGLTLLGIGFLFVHYLILHSVLDNPEMWKNQKDATPPPEAFFAIFKWFYILFGMAFLTATIANLLSGLFLLKRKHRTLSLIVAGLNCVQIPLGTVLGVFTLVVLLRPSVQELYTARAGDP